MMSIVIVVSDEEYAVLDACRSRVGFTWLQLLRTCKK